MGFIINPFVFGNGATPDYYTSGAVSESTTTTINVNLPTAAANDIGIIHMNLQSFTAAAAPDCSDPAGWTRIADQTRTGGTFRVRIILLAKRMTGSEGSTVAVTVSNPNDLNFAKASIYRGVTTSDPFYESVVYANGNGTSVSFAAVTTAGTGRILLDHIVAQENLVVSYSNRDLRYNEISFTNSDSTLALGTADASGSGAQAAGACTLDAARDWVSASLALKPA